MPDEISYTLLSDGSSDKALMPIIDWTIHQAHPALLIQANRADLTRLKSPPKKLNERIDKALELYPCDLLFVHRDSEGTSLSDRIAEIDLGTAHLGHRLGMVKIIPVRMMEAWLLIDELAIKTAAGNPGGRYKVDLPKLKQIETINDPKAVLREHLRQASGLKGRQLDKFNLGKAVHLVAENIIDFSPLNELSAYQAFQKDLASVLNTLGHIRH